LSLKKTFHPILLIVHVAILIWSITSYAQSLERFEYSEVHMGTLFRIVLYAKSENLANAASHKAYLRIEELNHIFSDYLQSSELSQISKYAHHHAVKVSDDMWTLLKLSDDLNAQSDGAFNIATGPLTKLWRRAIRRQEIPDNKKIKDALVNSDWNDVQLDELNHTIKFNRKGMRLDMGGVAKGYTVDQAYLILLGEGLAMSLVDGGGDIFAGDAPPDTKGWSIKIESNASQRSEDIILKNEALASSGSTFKFVEFEGRQYSHIVSPISGYGISDPITINVKAENCTVADALATTFCIQSNRQIVKRIAKYFKAMLL